MQLDGKEYTLKTRTDGTFDLRTAMLAKRIFTQFGLDDMEGSAGDEKKEVTFREGFIKMCNVLFTEVVPDTLDVWGLNPKEVNAIFRSFTNALSV